MCLWGDAPNVPLTVSFSVVAFILQLASPTNYLQHITA